MKPVAVLGAGIAGLVAARQFTRHGIPVVVFEAGQQVAGMAATRVDPDGFSYDIGGHFITNRLAAALGVSGQCRTVHHYGEMVRMNHRYYSYPFGLLRYPYYSVSAAIQRLQHSDIVSLADRFIADYGKALALEVAIPIVESWSGVSARDLAPAVADKIPQSITETIRLKLAARLTKRAVAIGYCGAQPQSASVFHVYPIEGVATLCQRLAADLDVHLESPVESIYVVNGQATGIRAGGRDIAVSAVVSTAPINVLPKLVQGADLSRFRCLRFRPMVMVNLKLAGTHLLPDTMVWTPGFPFFRLTEAPQAMPWLAPEGKTMVLAEIGASRGDLLWEASDDKIVGLCLGSLTTLIPDVEQRLLGATVLHQPLAYPVFHLDYEETRQRLSREGTGIPNLLSVGRNGEFDHILMEDIYWRTVRRVERYLQTQG
jgi:protoporphyrinogen oxidase